MNEDIRELMATIEFLRMACEHAEGKTKRDEEMLTQAMSVGIRINSKHKNLVNDYQMPTFWADVNTIPARAGLI